MIRYIQDSNGKTIALLLQTGFSESESVKFYSDPLDEFQFAVMTKKPHERIRRHFHPQQERNIRSTSEVIIMQKGGIEVELYDDTQLLIEILVLRNQDVLVLLAGGHAFKNLENNSQFIEIKQGPFDSGKDKTYF
jgi:hypothetical protein